MTENSNSSIEEKILEFIKSHHNQGETFSEIEKSLLDQNYNSLQIEVALQKFKKEFYNQKRNNGTKKIALGSILLFFGFILTVVNFHANSSFTIIMYGSSITGISLLFWGMYDIFS